MYEHYPFQLEPLPYAYNALEPYIDAKTVEVHHNRHLKTYVENLNKALEDCPQYHSWSLEKLIQQNQLLPKKIQKAVFNNAGGVYNHNFYFQMLINNGHKPTDTFLYKAILKCFGSYENFKKELSKASTGIFGSGYGWLLAEPNGSLRIATTANQETNLCMCGTKILNIDVWEHAYYLQYLNKRAEYVDNIFNIFNWQKAEELYLNCLKQIN